MDHQAVSSLAYTYVHPGCSWLKVEAMKHNCSHCHLAASCSCLASGTVEVACLPTGSPLPGCRFASEVVITGGAFAYATMMYGKVSSHEVHMKARQSTRAICRIHVVAVVCTQAHFCCYRQHSLSFVVLASLCM
jgi:hypothetical protein